ncbi:unannotated protein [freshwater metagenome]|uniref:Unannotated protein n=1 Tax=freshwater metagenome TaxID=449393 RepID=A0A6J7FRX7_9ZZZZ|nr:hypothetical protein [Actinomycetota bacterium]
MIFRPELATMVMAGEKTVTRRACSDNPRSPWYRGKCGVRVEQLVTVQPGRGRPNIGRAQVITVDRERLGHLDDAEARREGFPDAAAFEATFAELNGGYDPTLLVWRVVLAAERHELGADPATPRFTFRTSSDSPSQTVWCHHCGWVAAGGHRTFERADVHVCSLGPRAGLERHETGETR